MLECTTRLGIFLFGNIALQVSLENCILCCARVCRNKGESLGRQLSSLIGLYLTSVPDLCILLSLNMCINSV